VPENNSMTFSSVFLDKTPPVDVRIDEMIQWGKKLTEYRFVRGAEGSLSFRTTMGFIIIGNDISLDNIPKDMAVEVRGVVFGLNRPSIYAKGQVVPSKETLLHSRIYEALSEINAIICVPCRAILETAAEHGLPSTVVEQSAGSQELAQEAINVVKLNQSAKCFVLKNYGVVALGVTMSDAGKQIEAIRDSLESSAKSKPGKRKVSK
jgi:ribulose-5-phosphate 4-epimerase/fuculose-1-phosphate aldolase